MLSAKTPVVRRARPLGFPQRMHPVWFSTRIRGGQPACMGLQIWPRPRQGVAVWNVVGLQIPCDFRFDTDAVGGPRWLRSPDSSEAAPQRSTARSGFSWSKRQSCFAPWPLRLVPEPFFAMVSRCCLTRGGFTPRACMQPRLGSRCSCATKRAQNVVRKSPRCDLQVPGSRLLSALRPDQRNQIWHQRAGLGIPEWCQSPGSSPSPTWMESIARYSSVPLRGFCRPNLQRSRMRRLSTGYPSPTWLMTVAPSPAPAIPLTTPTSNYAQACWTERGNSVMASDPKF
jgi:hypothetical protein